MNNLPTHLLNFIKQHFEQEYSSVFQISAVKEVGGGCICRAVKLETSLGPYFLKWASDVPEHFFKVEAETLHLFRSFPNDFLIFPEPILSDDINLHTSLPGFLLLTWIDPEYKLGADEQFGHGLAQLHRNSHTAYGFDQNNFCGLTPQINDWTTSWTGFFIHQRLICLIDRIKKRRHWESSDEQLFERFLLKLPALLPDNPESSLVHGDLWSGNVIHSNRGTALIDPAASYSHREFELGMMLLFGGFSKRVYDAYHEAWPLESGWQGRAQIYQLYHVLNHYDLFGGGYKLQALQLMKKFT